MYLELKLSEYYMMHNVKSEKMVSMKRDLHFKLFKYIFLLLWNHKKYMLINAYMHVHWK